MAIGVEVSNLSQKRINKSFVSKVVKMTLLLSRVKIKSLSLSVVFVKKDRIQSLNRAYRRKNKPTDILSFNYSSGYNKKKAGELLLCPEIIENSARENKVSFKHELAFVLAHGVLHLLGFRHGRKMYDLQDKIINLK